MPNVLSPLRYPGGKSQMSSFVEKLIEVNKIETPIYVEPFAGGAGIAIDLLLNGKVKGIIINDLDRCIYAIWYSIINETNAFIDKILHTPINIKEWEKQKAIYNDQSNYGLLELGFATFFLNRTNTSGIISGGPIGGYNQSGKYKLNCRFNKAALIKKVSAISRKKSSISLYNYDARELINKVILNLDPVSTFIFFDPPYYKQGKNLYTNSLRKEDHYELATFIKGLYSYHWITTYDYEMDIFHMYKDFPSKFYNLQYSARKSRQEKEYLFHNRLTKVVSHDKVILNEVLCP